MDNMALINMGLCERKADAVNTENIDQIEDALAELRGVQQLLESASNQPHAELGTEALALLASAVERAVDGIEKAI